MTFWFWSSISNKVLNAGGKVEDLALHIITHTLTQSTKHLLHSFTFLFGAGNQCLEAEISAHLWDCIYESCCSSPYTDLLLILNDYYYYYCTITGLCLYSTAASNPQWGLEPCCFRHYTNRSKHSLCLNDFRKSNWKHNAMRSWSFPKEVHGYLPLITTRVQSSLK